MHLNSKPWIMHLPGIVTGSLFKWEELSSLTDAKLD